MSKEGERGRVGDGLWTDIQDTGKSLLEDPEWWCNMILLTFKGCVVCKTDDTRAESESWDSSAVAQVGDDGISGWVEVGRSDWMPDMFNEACGWTGFRVWQRGVKDNSGFQREPL